MTALEALLHGTLLIVTASFMMHSASCFAELSSSGPQV